jgi:large repetitive protein
MATAGPNAPGTLVDATGVGTLTWSSPGNAASSNNVYASFAHNATSYTTSHYLKATNFGFTIPEGSTINGIAVSIERKVGGSDPRNVLDTYVCIVKANGSIGSTNKGDLTTSWPASDTVKSYGSTSDLWGETWTDSDINDADFGVVLSAKSRTLAGEGSCVGYVDFISITVTYTEGAAPAGNPYYAYAQM